VARATSIYEELGVTPVINASGIYTHLGGSCLSPAVRNAATEANERWADMPELLERSGEAIAQMLGVDAARVVPGASAGLALAVGACMTGHDGRLMEQLPDTTGLPGNILMQRGHRYNYTRCALMTGARLVEAGDAAGTRDADFEHFLSKDIACVLHPAHLDGRNGTIPLGKVTKMAHEAGIPVVVDAAGLSYPTNLIAEFGRQGADLACFSAKYFWGPNSGGFLYGRKDLVQAIAEIDFTGFESGQHRIFAAFKMDRSTVVATTLALREWLVMDHDARWAGYRRRASRLVRILEGRAPANFKPGCFTLDERIADEPVNAVLVRPGQDSRYPAAGLETVLAVGSPSIRAIVVGDVLALCLETVSEDEDEIIIERLLTALNGDG
jgi:L-seryl-tRNA(Ser) seleniumtransferase